MIWIVSGTSLSILMAIKKVCMWKISTRYEAALPNCNDDRINYEIPQKKRDLLCTALGNRINDYWHGLR